MNITERNKVLNYLEDLGYEVKLYHHPESVTIYVKFISKGLNIFFRLYESDFKKSKDEIIKAVVTRFNQLIKEHS